MLRTGQATGLSNGVNHMLMSNFDTKCIKSLNVLFFKEIFLYLIGYKNENERFFAIFVIRMVKNCINNCFSKD